MAILHGDPGLRSEAADGQTDEVDFVDRRQSGRTEPIAISMARHTGGTMTLSARLVALLYAREASGLPSEILAKARLHVADTIAVAHAAASGLTIADEIMRSLQAGGSTGDCRVIGRAQTLPPAMAAFANCAFMHAIDFDDIHDATGIHPTPPTLAAALVAADLVPERTAKTWAAVSLGNELMCRLGSVCSPRGPGRASSWFLSQLLGYFGAVVSASVVLGLSEDQCVSAIGLAYQQAAGGKESAFGTGSTARSIYPGFAAMGAIQACLLARAGVAGPRSALDGVAGLFRIYFDQDPGQSELADLLDFDGWVWQDTAIKPWPSCRDSHAHIAAALDVASKLRGLQIDRIVVSISPGVASLCTPPKERRRPPTIQDAKFSIPFMTAFALAYGTVTLATLNERAFEDPVVLDLAKRVEVIEELTDSPGHISAKVAVTTHSETFAGACAQLPKPSRPEVHAKFLNCLEYAGLAGDHSRRLWDGLIGGDTRALSAALSVAEGRRHEPRALPAAG